MQFSAYMHNDLMRVIDQCARREHRSRSAMVSLLLFDGLSVRLERQEHEQDREFFVAAVKRIRAAEESVVGRSRRIRDPS